MVISSPNCRSAPASSAGWKPNPAGPATSWPSLPSWGIADSYGVELCHPVRSGRDFHQAGNKGKSNHRWIVGGKLCIVIKPTGPDHRLGLPHR